MGKTQDLGQRAEQDALRLMTGSGLTLVTRNYRCRGGEIDLIMRDGESIVFVEVRYRRSANFGGAVSSVDRRKRQRLTHAAQHYLAGSGWLGPCRFDVIGFDGSADPTWIRNAF